MKKILIAIVLTGSLITFSLQDSTAGNLTIPVSKTAVINAEQEQKAQVLLSRLEEIKALDKSSLTSSEKRSMRKEVRQIKSQLREMGGGIYLSAGAIIIIVLLLIILL